MQRQLQELLGPLVDSPIRYGDSAERSYLHAAQVHERQLWLGTVDIKDHFDNITEAHVRALMAAMGCPGEVADVLVPLVTYRGRLGQGLPTSTVIANLLLTGLDRQVQKVALPYHATAPAAASPSDGVRALAVPLLAHRRRHAYQLRVLDREVLVQAPAVHPAELPELPGLGLQGLHLLAVQHQLVVAVDLHPVLFGQPGAHERRWRRTTTPRLVVMADSESPGD